MDKQRIAILSYQHDASVEPYVLESFGKEFEINVPAENLLMAVCAHHSARKLIESGADASILTVGGAAISNMLIVQKINEMTGIEVPVEADNSSFSIASNIKYLAESESPFIIICQKFARLRTFIHANYHLGGGNFQLKDWETYIEENALNEFESKLICELESMKHVPLQRRLIEGVLTMLAYIDPNDGFTKSISLLRNKLRRNSPSNNFFNSSGLS